MSASPSKKTVDVMEAIQDVSSVTHFNVGARIGKGTFGEVYTASLRDAKNGVVCIKKVSMFDMEVDEQVASLNEVRVLAFLDNPYIVKYFASFIENNSLYIVMEYAESGTLHQKLKALKAKNQLMEEEEIWFIFIQICLGLLHIHSKDVLHRDLKSDNIFLCQNDVVKIGDLGVAKILDHGAMTRTLVGTPYYLSPELCAGHEYNSRSDVWALGVILYEMCALEPPFQAKNQPALFNCILVNEVPPLPDRYSDDLVSIVLTLLRKNPRLRPSVEQLLRDPTMYQKGIALQKRVNASRSQAISHASFQDSPGSPGDDPDEWVEVESLRKAEDGEQVTANRKRSSSSSSSSSSSADVNTDASIWRSTLEAQGALSVDPSDVSVWMVEEGENPDEAASISQSGGADHFARSSLGSTVGHAARPPSSSTSSSSSVSVPSAEEMLQTTVAQVIQAQSDVENRLNESRSACLTILDGNVALYDDMVVFFGTVQKRRDNSDAPFDRDFEAQLSADIERFLTTKNVPFEKLAALDRVYAILELMKKKVDLERFLSDVLSKS